MTPATPLPMTHRDTPSTPPEIDLVYAWVDGNDPELQKDLRRHATSPEQLNPERFRDLHDLLRYSLRSVAAFLPWIRHVYIITRRPQVPPWLNTDNPRVRVVHHDELPGFSTYLPTFNSTVIESFVPAIPGSSDHLLYLNDDFLFGAPTSREDFITPGGRHKVLGTYFGLWLPFRIYRKRWKVFSSVHLEHCPRLLYRPFWDEMLRVHAGDLHRTRLSRFRTGSDLRMDRLYRMWLLGPKRRHSQAVPSKELLRYHRFHRIGNDVGVQAKALGELREMAPRFYCLNDDQGTDPNPEVVRLVRDFLRGYYPEPSEFEVGEER